MSEFRHPHRIQGGALFRANGACHGHTVRCSCGWESELSATLVFAEAEGEQHVQLHQSRRSLGDRSDVGT